MPVDESWSLVGVLARAWDEGKVAGRSVTMRRMSDEPGAPEPVNPYRRVEVHCNGHKPVQHRDDKPPWCDACGRDIDGQTISRPKGWRPRG